MVVIYILVTLVFNYAILVVQLMLHKKRLRKTEIVPPIWYFPYEMPTSHCNI